MYSAPDLRPSAASVSVNSLMYAPPQSRPFCSLTSYCTTRGLPLGSMGSSKRVEMAWWAALDSTALIKILYQTSLNSLMTKPLSPLIPG